MDAGISDCLGTIRTAAIALVPPRPSPLLATLEYTGREDAVSEDEVDEIAGDSHVAVEDTNRQKKRKLITHATTDRGDSGKEWMFDPRAAGLVSESQDLEAWTERYEANEAQAKRSHAPSSTLAPVQGRQTLSSTLAVPVTIMPPPAAIARHSATASSIGVYYDGSRALVEYARSGRSTCVACRQVIANRALRFGVLPDAGDDDYYEPNTVFMHLECGPIFNTARALYTQQGLIRYDELRGLSQLSVNDRNQVRQMLS